MKLVKMLFVTLFMVSILSFSVFADDLDGLKVPMNEDCPNSWRYEDGVRKEIEKKGRPEIQPFTMVPEEAKAVGIDVSHYKGRIDWEMVKENIDFAILSCGYGSNFTSQDDRYWTYNVSECERLDIPYGVYLYSYALSSEQAKSEANHALRLLEGHHPSLPVFYDLEEEDRSTGLPKCSNAQLLVNTKIFCSMLEEEGYEVGVYANRTWWNKFLTDTTYNQWERWVADYGSMCKYTGEFTYWQYSEKGTVPGISEPESVDMNYSKKEIKKGNENTKDDVLKKEIFFANIVCNGAGNSSKKYLGVTKTDNVELMEKNGYATVWCFNLLGDSSYCIKNVKNGKDMKLVTNGGVGTNIYTELFDYFNIYNWNIMGNAAECELQLQGSPQVVVDIDVSPGKNQGNAQLGDVSSVNKQYQKFSLEEVELKPIALSYEQNGAEMTFTWGDDFINDLDCLYLNISPQDPFLSNSYMWNKVSGLNSQTLLLESGYYTAQLRVSSGFLYDSNEVEFYIPNISSAEEKSNVYLQFIEGKLEVTVENPQYAIEYGLLIADGSVTNYKTEGRTKIVFTKLDSNNKFYFTPAINIGKNIYKAYIIYDSGSGKRIVYSDWISLSDIVENE